MTAASDFFNVFTAEFSKLSDSGFGDAESRVLYQGADGRSLVTVTRFPNGGGFTFAPSGYEEVFYIAAGTGTRTLPSGEKLEMNPGDLIYVHQDVDVEYTFEPGFVDVALFWSDEPLDPSLAGGLPAHVNA